MQGNKRLATYFGLFVSLILPFILHYTAFHLPLLMYIVMKWILVFFLLLLIVLFRESRNLDSIGFRKPSWGDLIYGFPGFVVGAILFVITSYLLVLLGLRTTSPGILRIAEIPFSIRGTDGSNSRNHGGDTLPRLSHRETLRAYREYVYCRIPSLARIHTAPCIFPRSGWSH